MDLEVFKDSKKNSILRTPLCKSYSSNVCEASGIQKLQIIPVSDVMKPMFVCVCTVKFFSVDRFILVLRNTGH